METRAAAGVGTPTPGCVPTPMLLASMGLMWHGARYKGNVVRCTDLNLLTPPAVAPSTPTQEGEERGLNMS